MKNALIRIILISIIACVSSISTTTTSAQYSLKMKVPYKSQDTNRWCWAASVKMIMDFHDPGNNITQCNIVKRMLKIENPSLDTNSIICCQNCLKVCGSSSCVGSIAGFTNYALTSTSDGGLNPHPDRYDLLFFSYGYNSTQQVNRAGNPISKEKIIQQIKDCQPFIINTATSATAGSSGVNGDHALVVTGYQIQNVNGQEQFAIITNDPWRPCCTDTHESFFPYDIFNNPSNGISGSTSNGSSTPHNINQVISIVHNIRKDLVFAAPSYNCNSCPLLTDTYRNNPNGFLEETTSSPTAFSIINGDQPIAFGQKDSPPPPSEEVEHTEGLLKLLRNNANKVVGYQNFNLSDSTYQNFITSAGYHYAPVQYIDPALVRKRGFLACLFQPRRLAQVTIPMYDVVDIVSANVDENLVSTLQKLADGSWSLRRISNYTYLRSSTAVTIGQSDRAVSLSNVPSSSASAIPFTLVKYFPYQYEFFSFKLNGTTYIAPTNDYPSLSLNKHTAYKEAHVIKALRREQKILSKNRMEYLVNPPSNIKKTK